MQRHNIKPVMRGVAVIFEREHDYQLFTDNPCVRLQKYKAITVDIFAVRKDEGRHYGLAYGKGCVAVVKLLSGKRASVEHIITKGSAVPRGSLYTTKVLLRIPEQSVYIDHISATVLDIAELVGMHGRYKMVTRSITVTGFNVSGEPHLGTVRLGGLDVKVWRRGCLWELSL